MVIFDQASVWCFTWYCWPKWAVSVLEWLSERLLGRMSGTCLNSGMSDFNRACMCCVCNSLPVLGACASHWLKDEKTCIILLYMRIRCSCFYLLIFFPLEMQISMLLIDNEESVSESVSVRSPSRREAGDVWCLPPAWKLRAVIWFHFTIASLVLLPSPITLSVWSFFLPPDPFSWLFSPENSIFFVDGNAFGMAPV